MMQDDYNITVRPITTRNPQANAILERAYQTIGNILRTFKVQNMVLDDINPWDGILAATIYTPAQLVFGCDSLINVSHEANWQLIKASKQALFDKGNARENCKRKEYTYKSGDKVLLKKCVED